ncbi:hypothetical protein [Embleya sp. NBC_00888]|uniref:hypothetical protein n=1 Tax=Embleya sp. NBC_00888 TaxID=2975960 RepID=UPI003863CD2D
MAEADTVVRLTREGEQAFAIVAERDLGPVVRAALRADLAHVCFTDPLPASTASTETGPAGVAPGGTAETIVPVPGERAEGRQERLNTGFQYEPVASMPTAVTCSASNQSRIANGSRVMVVKVRTSLRRRLPGPGTRTQNLHVDRADVDPGASFVDDVHAPAPPSRFVRSNDDRPAGDRAGKRV